MITETVVWHPAGETTPLALDIGALFSAILDT